MFQVYQPVLTTLGFALIFAIVYFLGRIPPIGNMYATVFILIGKVLLRIEQWIEPFDTARRTNGSKNPGLRTIILVFSCFLALAALIAETFNTLQSLSALFTDASIALPALPGVLNFSMGLLFLAVPALIGSVYLEIKNALPEEAKIFVVPEKHAQKFERYIVGTFVLSVITSITFYALKAVYLFSPDSNGTHLLQIVSLILLGCSLPLVGAIILYILALGVHSAIGLLLTIVWFIAATLTDIFDFLSRLFTGEKVLPQGVRDKKTIAVKEETEQTPGSVLQIEKAVSQVLEAEKKTNNTAVKVGSSSHVETDEVEILIPPPQEEITISKQDEELYQTVLQIVEQRKKEIERIAEEKRKAEEVRKQEAWSELESEIKKKAMSDWRNFDAEAEVVYVLDHCLPVDVVLSGQEYREWRTRLRDIGVQTRKEEQEREKEAQRQAEQERSHAVLERLEEHKAEMEQVLSNGRMPRYYKRKSLPIEAHGNQPFLDSIQRVLDELREKAPYRYEEVIHFIPKAEYVPSMTGTLAGRSDGLFSINGSGELRAGKWLNTYEWYRFVFLHEVGHCVHTFLSNDHSETSADAYAKQVLDEMGIDITQKHWWQNRAQNCAPMLPIE